MSISKIYCDECGKYVDAEEIKVEYSSYYPDKMLRTSVCIDCNHKILDTRPSSTKEAKKWSLTKKITLSLREKQDLDAVKSNEEPANEFIYNLLRYVTSTKTRFREWNEWRKAHDCYYPPSDFSEDDVFPPDDFKMV